MAVKDVLWARAVQKGFFGTSRFWLVVVVVLGARRIVRRLTRDTPTTVFSQKLEPGEGLTITHLPGDAKIDARLET